MLQRVRALKSARAYWALPLLCGKFLALIDTLEIDLIIPDTKSNG
jgi:hypothetical protein